MTYIFTRLGLSILLITACHPDNRGQLKYKDAPEPEQKCGFANGQEVEKEGRATLRAFTTFNQLDPAFWVDPGNEEFKEIVAQTAASSAPRYALERVATLAVNPWLEPLVQQYQELLTREDTAALVQISGMPLKFVTDNEECDGACTQYMDYGVLMNTDFVRILSDEGQNLSPALGVLGHELGHFIVDFYDWSSGEFHNYEELQASRQDNFLRYHLRVDAVGMVLAGMDSRTFGSILSKAATIGGEGDLLNRAKCLTQHVSK